MTVEFDGLNGSFDSMDTALQEYLYKIKHIKGIHNVTTDVLSRIILLLSEIISERIRRCKKIYLKIEESDLFNSFRESVCVRRQAYSDYQNLKPWVILI